MAEETPKCPCKEKLTDGEKNVLSFGLNNINNLLKNPNQAAIGLTRAVAGRNSATLDGLIALAAPPLRLIGFFNTKHLIYRGVVYYSCNLGVPCRRPFWKTCC